jgi:hypothetical protein
MNDPIDEERFFADLTIPYHHIHTFPSSHHHSSSNHSLFLGSQSAVGGFPDQWNHTEADYQQVREALIQFKTM